MAMDRFSLIEVAEKSPNMRSNPILSLVDLKENIGILGLDEEGDGIIFGN